MNSSVPNLFDNFRCLRQFLSALNFTNNTLNQVEEDFCESLEAVERILTNHIFRPIILLLLFLLILISVYKNKEENYKWIIWHSAILNYILMIFCEWAYFKQLYASKQATQADLRTVFQYVIYLGYLAMLSLFPLSVHRFCSLYFPNFYDNFLAKKLGLLIFLLGYDFCIVGLFYINNKIGTSTLEGVIKFVLMFLELSLSILLYLKIKEMIKMVSNTSNLKTMEDLYRVSIVCALQALFYTSYLLIAVLGDIFFNIIKRDAWYVRYYLVFFVYLLCWYELVLILDSCLILFMLKSYRLVLISFLEYFWQKVRGFYNRYGNGQSTVTIINGNLLHN